MLDKIDTEIGTEIDTEDDAEMDTLIDVQIDTGSDIGVYADPESRQASLYSFLMPAFSFQNLPFNLLSKIQNPSLSFIFFFACTLAGALPPAQPSF